MGTFKNMKSGIGVLSIVLLVLIPGCFGTNVSLSNYQPRLAGDYSFFKGQRVYLMNFENQANDTNIWGYYSPDRQVIYSSKNTLHNYFWYAFRDALVNSGVMVSNMDNPDLTAPAMWITLLSMTDEKYQVRVTIQKKGITTFAEPYIIEEPPLKEKERNVSILEQRAYRMTNRLIEVILKDPKFQKALTEK